MKFERPTSKQLRLTVLLFCSLTTLGTFGRGQTSSETNPIKLDAYENLSSDDEAARLDLFADKLNKQPKLKGSIIAYSDSRMGRGSYLRRIYGIAKYLTHSRGIEANRVTVIDGGYKEQFSTELWLIPEGADSPSPFSGTPQPTMNTSSAYKFDEECLDCSLAVDLELDGLDEGLQFYAEALRKDPGARGVMIVRPDEDLSIRKALREARKARTFLITRYGINAKRLIVKSASSRKDGTAIVEMWVVPAGAVFPTATSNKRVRDI